MPIKYITLPGIKTSSLVIGISDMRIKKLYGEIREHANLHLTHMCQKLLKLSEVTGL